jgi:hypothetical protein
LAARDALAEIDAAGACVVGEPAGAYDGRIEPARADRVVRAALGPQVHAESVVAGCLGVRPHAADDHVAADACLLRRRDQLDRAPVVHRLFSLRAAPRTGAGSEHDGVAAGNRLRDIVLGRMLEIDHNGLGTDLPYLVRVAGVADQGDGLVAAL